MYCYRFTGFAERVFGHLQHGPHLSVEHTVEPGDQLPPATEDGQTVVLRPGDTLFVDEPETHAELEPADRATADAHAVDDEPVRLPTRKADLAELARARGLDDSGTVADLTARLTEPQE